MHPFLCYTLIICVNTILFVHVWTINKDIRLGFDLKRNWLILFFVCWKIRENCECLSPRYHSFFTLRLLLFPLDNCFIATLLQFIIGEYPFLRFLVQFMVWVVELQLDKEVDLILDDCFVILNMNIIFFILRIWT